MTIDIKSKRLHVPRDLVGPQGPLGSTKCFLSKLLDVCLAGSVIHDGLVICALGLGCLQALNQAFCVCEAIVVGGVEALGNDLVDRMVLAWGRCQHVLFLGRFMAIRMSRMRERSLHQYAMAGLIVRSWFARLINRLTSGILRGGGRGSALMAGWVGGSGQL